MTGAGALKARLCCPRGDIASDGRRVGCAEAREGVRHGRLSVVVGETFRTADVDVSRLCQHTRISRLADPSALEVPRESKSDDESCLVGKFLMSHV
jgi:hypothetical protein